MTGEDSLAKIIQDSAWVYDYAHALTNDVKAREIIEQLQQRIVAALAKELRVDASADVNRMPAQREIMPAMLPIKPAAGLAG